MALLTAAVAHASTLGQASPFNIVSFGSISSSSDIAGRVAVQGTVNSNLQIGSNGEIQLNFNNVGVDYQSAFTTVLNSGNNTFLVRQNTDGNIYAPNSDNNVVYQNNTQPVTIVKTPPSPIDWAGLYSDMITLSTSLRSASALTVAGTSNVSINTTGQSSDVLLYRLTLAQFQNLGSIVTNGKTVLIDVDLTSVAPNSAIATGNSNFTVDGAQPFAGNTAAKRVLFNFCGGNVPGTCAAEMLNINTGWYGTILAPTTTVQGGSQFNGQMIVGNLNYTGEIHGTPFQGDLPGSGVPEPSSFIPVVCAIGAFAFRKLRAAA